MATVSARDFQDNWMFLRVWIISGHDVIAQAQSGTGKTATFSIAILQQIDVTLKECQALVLAPTRELAQQIQKVCFKKY